MLYSIHIKSESAVKLKKKTLVFTLKLRNYKATLTPTAVSKTKKVNQSEMQTRMKNYRDRKRGNMRVRQ